jgi:hypothetical protein
MRPTTPPRQVVDVVARCVTLQASGASESLGADHSIAAGEHLHAASQRRWKVLGLLLPDRPRRPVLTRGCLAPFPRVDAQIASSQPGAVPLRVTVSPLRAGHVITNAIVPTSRSMRSELKTSAQKDLGSPATRFSSPRQVPTNVIPPLSVVASTINGGQSASYTARSASRFLLKTTHNPPPIITRDPPRLMVWRLQ